MKSLAVLLAITLLFTWYAPAYADAGAGPDRIIEVRPNGFTYKKTIDPQGKSRITYVKERIISLEEYSRIVNLARTQTGTAYAVNKSWTGNPEVAGVFNRFFNDTKLFLRGFGDVYRASSGGMFSEQQNLNDPAKRYEFWQKQGIYDRYTVGERAFLNKVVFPVVAAARGLTMIGALGIGSFVVAGMVGASAPLVFLGAVAVLGGITAYKAYQMKKKGADIAAIRSDPDDRINKFTGANLLAMFGSMGGAAKAASVAGLSGMGIAASAGAAGASSFVAANESFDIVRLVNEWGIPEKTTLTEAEFTPVADPGPVYETLYLNYRLTK